MKKLKELKKGEYFRLRKKGKLYVRGEYVRDLKRYSYYDYDNVNKEHFAKGEIKIITDF